MKGIQAAPLLVVTLTAVVMGMLACSGTDDVVVPPDTELAIRLTTTMRSDRVTPGVKLRGILEKPIVIDGNTVLEPGHPVTLEVVQSLPAEGDAPTRVSLVLTRLGLPSGRTDVETETLEVVGRPAPPAPPVDEIAVVGEAVVGGVLDGGGIGGALGAAAGGVIAVTTKGGTIVLPAGRKLTFVTSEPLEIPRS